MALQKGEIQAQNVQAVNAQDKTEIKATLDLNNVDNTADVNKPISTPQQNALDDKVDKVAGKGLSDENYTLAEKNLLANQSNVNTGDQDLTPYALKSNVLELDNTTTYTPTLDYHPATKKYVDDNVTNGDMLKSVYDTNNDGVVDDSETLGGQAGAYYLNRTNHTGTQTASTISDFDTEVSNNADVSANSSKNSYPTSDANKLAGIEAGAEVNVQSDFAQSDNNQDDFILNRPIQAETNLTLTGAVSIDITAKQSYIYNLTGNVDLTIDASNVANNESYVIELRVTTDTGVETLSLLNTTDTKDIYGTYDPAVVNKLVISATKDGSGNVYLTYIFNQPN